MSSGADERNPTPMTQDPSNWANATQALLAQLSCPRCDAANRPHVHWIAMHNDGHANCKQCGFGAAVQEFIPKRFGKEEHP